MDAAGYTTLTRQSGLMREMQSVANNIANLSTTGFRREGIVFAEHVRRLDGDPSLSMAHASARQIDLSQGGLNRTGASFDFAIQGEGFFLIDTADGQQLTRAGSFTPSPEGELVDADGNQLLDEGAAPIFVPPDARNVMLASDGTLSADGQPIGRVGLWQPVNPLDLRHQGGTRFAAEGGRDPDPGCAGRVECRAGLRDCPDDRGSARLRTWADLPRPRGRAHPLDRQNPRPGVRQ